MNFKVSLKGNIMSVNTLGAVLLKLNSSNCLSFGNSKSGRRGTQKKMWKKLHRYTRTLCVFLRKRCNLKYFLFNISKERDCPEKVMRAICIYPHIHTRF